jgi:hypothetical protein
MRSERLEQENMPWGERRQGEGISVRHVVFCFHFLARSILSDERAGRCLEEI